jgi:acetyl-CoA carboxylase beta subunit
MVFHKDLESNQFVIPSSGHHMKISARERLKFFFDDGRFEDVIALADRALRLDARNAPARHFRAAGLAESGRAEEALQGGGSAFQMLCSRARRRMPSTPPEHVFSDEPKAVREGNAA